jgi:hypothetical protein
MSTTPASPKPALSIPLRLLNPEEAWEALLAAHLTNEVEAIDPNSKHCSGLCNMDSGICEGHPTGSLDAVTGFESDPGEEPLYLYGEHAEARAKLIALLPNLIYTLRETQRQNQQYKDALRGEPTSGDP